MGNLIDWNQIVSLGAGAAADFGDPLREFAAARSGVIVSPLTHFSLLRFRGSQAKAFLQGQLTCDVEQVQAAQAQFGGYCTSKGRLLANFLLLPAPEGYLMYLPADIASGLAQRLRKFILRAQVTVEVEETLAMLGLAGPGAPALVQQELGLPSLGGLALARHAGTQVLRLPGETFLLFAAAGEMGALWERVTSHALPVGARCWSWVQILATLPWVTSATQDQFLPQMIGLDAMGGVSFDKGCYTGQEIVARSRYLGEVKRSLYRGRTAAELQPADKLLSGGQPCGVVLNPVAVPAEESHFLAVVSSQSAGEASVQTSGGVPVVLEGPLTPSVAG
jgi:folate-binding protein YgfZ